MSLMYDTSFNRLIDCYDIKLYLYKKKLNKGDKLIFDSLEC